MITFIMYYVQCTCNLFVQILCWASFNAIISFMKTSITSIFRYQEGKSLVLIGTIGQISAGIGALIGSILINYTKIFSANDPCS